ncbi:MAG: hypothetical protein ACRDPW_05800, partial [Mycobacteriales bacterium]
MYGYQYVPSLAEQTQGLSAAELGEFWAERVLNAPLDTDVAGWRELDVRVFTTEHPYMDVVLAACDAAAADLVVAGSFVAALRGHEKVLSERIPRELSTLAATRTLGQWELDREARVLVVDWLLAQVADPQLKLNAVLGGLDIARGTGRDADTVAEATTSVLNVVNLLSDPWVATELSETLRAQHAARRHAAEVAAAARAAQLAADEHARQLNQLIIDDPAEAFTQLATELALTPARIASLHLPDHPQLLAACRSLATAVAASNVDSLPELAGAVLDRAVAQHHQGAPGLERAVQVYQEIPVLTAGSREEFGEQLAQLPGVSGMSADAIRGLYQQWIHLHTERGLSERRFAALASPAAAQLAALTPEKFVVTATGYAPTGAEYNSMPDLLAHVRRYFVPVPGVTGAVGQQAAPQPQSTTAGVEVAGSVEETTMQRLEAVAGAWSRGEASVEVDPDSPDTDGPKFFVSDQTVTADFYGLEDGMFGGHTLKIDHRGADGTYTLRLGGPNSLHGGPSNMEQFAAVVGASLTRESPRVTYTMLPPDNIADLPLDQAPYWTPNTLGAYFVRPPIGQISAHLAAIPNTEVSEQSIAAQLAGEPPHTGRSPSDYRAPRAALTVKAGTHGRVTVNLPQATVALQPRGPA